MEHLIIKKQDDGFYSIRAEEGYAVFSIELKRTFPEAVVNKREINSFTAIPINS